MRLLAVCLLLALPARAGDRVDEWIRLLDDEDAALRRSAQGELMRLGAAVVERVLPLIDRDDVEVRRFARQLIGRQLRAGLPTVRRQIIRLLELRGTGALGFVPDLEAVGRRYGGELGYVARVASMRIGGTRQHVRYLAARSDAYDILMAFDPERGRLLRETYRCYERRRRSAKELEKFLTLLAAADDGAYRYLAECVGKADGDDLVTWLRITSYVTRWPPEIGRVLAAHIDHESGRVLAAVADTLLRGPDDWTPIAPAIVASVLQRLGNTVDFTRTHLVLVAGRCGLEDQRVRSVLEQESKRPGPAGVAALCALKAAGENVADPVARVAGLGPVARRETLSRLALTGSRECVPVLLDRLAHGDASERNIVLAAAEVMPAARELLPGLADLAEMGTASDVHRAVRAATHTDGRLEWHGTESIVLRGLTHPSGLVRGKSVYACDYLERLTPKIVSALERLGEDREVATPMAWFLPNVRRLGRRAELMVPMLAGIVKRGPGAGLLWGRKSAVRWRRECLQALTEIRPMHPLARAAFRDGIGSSDRLTRILALRGFRQLERPERKDYAAVRRAMDDKSEGVRRAAGVVLMSQTWQQARMEWKEREAR